MRPNLLGFAVFAALLVRSGTARADVALMVFNADDSTLLLLEDATGYVIVREKPVTFGADGLATRLGNSSEDVCGVHGAYAVMAIDFAGGRTVAGPVVCGAADPMEDSRTTASWWTSKLELWPAEVTTRQAIWLGTVLNRAYAKLGIDDCVTEKALDSVLSASRISGLHSTGEKLASFPLTFCTIADKPVAPFVDLELLMSEIAPELHESLETLQAAMPSLARRAARLVVANAFSRQRKAVYMVSSGTWRTECTLEGKDPGIAKRKNLETPISIECTAESTPRKVFSTGRVAKMTETFRGTTGHSLESSTARDGLVVMGSELETEQEVAMAFAVVGNREKSKVQNATGWKKLSSPNGIKFLQAPLDATKRGGTRKETVSMRYVADDGECLFWLEDVGGAPRISDRTTSSCTYSLDTSSRGVTAYRSPCQCMSIVRNVKHGDWTIEAP